MRHAEVGEHDLERLTAAMRPGKDLDPFLTAACGGDLVAVALERIEEGLQQERVIVNDQNTQTARDGGYLGGR